MRNHLRLGIDLAWVVLSALLALLIRDNFVPYGFKFLALMPYVLLSVASAAVVFTVTVFSVANRGT